MSRRPVICIVGGGLIGLSVGFYLKHLKDRNYDGSYKIPSESRILILEKEGSTSKSFRTTQISISLIEDHLHSDSHKNFNEKYNLDSVRNNILYLGLQKHVSLPPKQLEIQASQQNVIKKILHLDFQNPVWHLRMPGGSHLLYIIQKTILASHVLRAQRGAASAFGLPCNSLPHLLKTKFATFKNGVKQARVPHEILDRSRLGFSRLYILGGVASIFLDIFRLRKHKIINSDSELSGLDCPVQEFAASRTLHYFSENVLLPVFNSLSLGADPQNCSSASYFPKAWNMTLKYGSVLRGIVKSRYHRDDVASASSVDSLSIPNFKISPEYFKEVMHSCGGIFAIPYGFRQVLNNLTDQLKGEDVDILCNKCVTGIKYSGKDRINKDICDIEVFCSDNTSYPVDYVITALNCTSLIKLINGTSPNMMAYCNNSNSPNPAKILHNFYKSIPVSDVIYIHAFAPNTKHAVRFGRGIYYHYKQFSGTVVKADAITNASVETLFKIRNFIQSKMILAKLEIPSNLFPQYYARIICPANKENNHWIDFSPFLHVYSAIRVIDYSNMMLGLRPLLDQLNESMDKEFPSVESITFSPEVIQSLLIWSAEDILTERLINEAIIKSPEQLLCVSNVHENSNPFIPLSLNAPRDIAETYCKLLDHKKDLFQGSAIPFIVAKKAINALLSTHYPWLYISGPMGNLNEWGNAASLKSAPSIAKAVAQMLK